MSKMRTAIRHVEANRAALVGFLRALERLAAGLEPADAEGVFWGVCLDALDADGARARRATDALERENITSCARDTAVRQNRAEMQLDAESEWTRGAASVFDVFAGIRPTTMPKGLGALYEISAAMLDRLAWDADRAECGADLARGFALCAHVAGVQAVDACQTAQAAAAAAGTKNELFELVYVAFDVAHLLRWCRRAETQAAITAARLEIAGCARA